MALHKVQIMARDTVSEQESYINLTDHKLAVDVGSELPDTAAGDLASMADDLGTIKADIAAIRSILES